MVVVAGTQCIIVVLPVSASSSQEFGMQQSWLIVFTALSLQRPHAVAVLFAMEIAENKA